MKLCECGCGQPAPIAKKTKPKWNHIKGQPVRFVHGHYAKTQPRGKYSHNWKGGVKTSVHQRVLIYKPEHPEAMVDGYVFRSRMVAEKALGKHLPHGVKVHHADGDCSNDTSENLVICENHAFHMLLHQRKNSYDACGHVGWLKCSICKQHDHRNNIYIRPNATAGAYHYDCLNRLKREKRKEANA